MKKQTKEQRAHNIYEYNRTKNLGFFRNEVHLAYLELPLRKVKRRLYLSTDKVSADYFVKCLLQNRAQESRRKRKAYKQNFFKRLNKN